MSYLNLMGNKLKPKEVNDALESLTNGTPTPEPTEISADDVEYDNTTSHLSATNVQSAIDEINTTVNVIPVIKQTTKKGSTTSAGLFNISDIAPQNILSITAPSGTNAFCLWREQSTEGKTVVLVLDGSLAPIASTELTLNVTYI